MGAWSKTFAVYKTKHFGIYKFCKHPLTCFRTFFVDFLVHTVKLKPFIKAQISGKLLTSGISDVATVSVHSEKTWAKKWIMIIIIIMNKSQELTVFHGRQNLTSAKN